MVRKCLSIWEKIILIYVNVQANERSQGNIRGDLPILPSEVLVTIQNMTFPLCPSCFITKMYRK